MSQDDFLKLLAAFNEEGFHFSNFGGGKSDEDLVLDIGMVGSVDDDNEQDAEEDETMGTLSQGAPKSEKKKKGPNMPPRENSKNKAAPEKMDSALDFFGNG